LPLAERLELLETTLDSEIALRESLQAELAAITEQMAELQGADGAGDSQDEPRRENLDVAAIQARVAERFGDGRRDDPDRRLNQLVEAGFSPDQAQHITARESELQLEALYAQYDRVLEGEPFDPRTGRFDPQDQLRQELGDASYERYLDATGQSTSISVQSVMAGSAGQTAGLQPGDQVVSYGGERVFSTADLNQLILDGSPGQTVVVDVLRDGQQIQVYVPRGPIGITSGRGRGGGR
jgi:C-terminal processing protease CtpA/Prc